MAGGEEINGPGGCLIGQVVLQGLVFRLVNYIAAATAAAAATMVYFVLLLLTTTYKSRLTQKKLYKKTDAIFSIYGKNGIIPWHFFLILSVAFRGHWGRMTSVG